MIVAESASASAARAHSRTAAQACPPPKTRPSAAALAAADTDGDPLGALAEVVESAAARSGEAVLVVPEGDRLVALATDGGAAVAACVEYASALESSRPAPEAYSTQAATEGPVIGLSAPSGPIARPPRLQAGRAGPVGGPPARTSAWSTSTWRPGRSAPSRRDAVRAFADGLLRALRDRRHRGDLSGLPARLAVPPRPVERGGGRTRRSPTATLRYRMRRVEEDLGRSWTTRTYGWSCMPGPEGHVGRVAGQPVRRSRTRPSRLDSGLGARPPRDEEREGAAGRRGGGGGNPPPGPPAPAPPPRVRTTRPQPRPPAPAHGHNVEPPTPPTTTTRTNAPPPHPPYRGPSPRGPPPHPQRGGPGPPQ
ncbi:hypothetical protein LV779_17610 [Streptomyces thinghirensis]|nr:hypothetical protein [Streptomyces thinghirensis]